MVDSNVTVSALAVASGIGMNIAKWSFDERRRTHANAAADAFIDGPAGFWWFHCLNPRHDLVTGKREGKRHRRCKSNSYFSFCGIIQHPFLNDQTKLI
jgi:hypothetical protein